MAFNGKIVVFPERLQCKSSYPHLLQHDRTGACSGSFGENNHIFYVTPWLPIPIQDALLIAGGLSLLDNSSIHKLLQLMDRQHPSSNHSAAP